MKISIIGSGFVGEKVGRGFSTLGQDVIFHDINNEVLSKLDKEFETSSDLEYTIKNTSISFICVPTPYNNGFDSKYIESALRDVSKVLKHKDDYHLVVIKSTVPPTMTRQVFLPILNENTEVGERVGLCMNPEFMTQHAESWTDDQKFSRNFNNEDRIVIGEFDKKSGDTLQKLYEPLKLPIFRTDLDTSEMIKYASNCMLATKISFWNQIFLICNKLGIDSDMVAEISSLDPRIGTYGIVHGKAFGGACLEKDLKSFIEFADEFADESLLQAVNKINEEMKKNFGIRC